MSVKPRRAPYIVPSTQGIVPFAKVDHVRYLLQRSDILVDGRPTNELLGRGRNGSATERHVIDAGVIKDANAQ